MLRWLIVNIKDMVIETRQFINSEKVKVSFELSYDDWCLIQQSECWRHIQNFLEESESRGIQMPLKDKVRLLERGWI